MKYAIVIRKDGKRDLYPFDWIGVIDDYVTIRYYNDEEVSIPVDVIHRVELV